MTHRLWFKLISAFALVTAIGVLVTVILTRQGAETRFAHFMLDHHMVRPERMQQVLAEQYEKEQRWDNLPAILPLLMETASDGAMSNMMGSMMGMHNNRIQVVNLAGQVVADSAGPAGGARLVTSATQRWPIMVAGQEVGSLLVEGSLMTGSPVRHASLLEGITRSVVLAGLAAGLVGLLLALLLVRQITRPLATLTQASHRIAEGDLGVRVPVQSRDELGDLAVTFNHMANSLQTQETLRRNLVADIAHELRTPLAGIQGTVEAMQDGVFALDQENLASIHSQMCLLNRLVEDLRALAHAEAEQLTLEQMAVDLPQLCEAEVVAFQSQATEHGVTLTLECEQNIPVIHGDSQRLGQVLKNLLANALRHTPAGGQVQVTLTSPGDGNVQLSVIDSGEGISAVDLPHLFERFYRGDGSRSRQTGGAGLGLAIVRQWVQLHGGKVWAESPPTGGTVGSAFHVQLPIQGHEPPI
jgi:signal transduction histidine kinase